MNEFGRAAFDITKTTLMSAEEICNKLGVSRSSLDRWRRLTGTPSPFGTAGGGFQTQVNIEMRSPEDLENDVGLTPFPEPTVHVGGSPRWDADDVSQWVMQNRNVKSRRGIR